MSLPDSKRQFVIEQIRPYGRLVVALSGGVDSAVLLALSREALGPEAVLAITAISDSLPRRDLEDARSVSSWLGVEHELVETAELGLPEYRANDENRCFYCRDELFRVLRKVAQDRGITEIAYGAIKDDIGDYRPGMKAAVAWGIRAPLLEAGVDKQAVREIALDFGLSVDTKPAAACLASRIPGGTEVTVERLRSVESAEEALRELGFGQLRVRHHGDVARIELENDDLARLGDPVLRSRVVAAVRNAGFRFCALDLEGYRAGSLNVVDPGPGNPARTGGQ
jgi:uncharacterized protein